MLFKGPDTIISPFPVTFMWRLVRTNASIPACSVYSGNRLIDEPTLLQINTQSVSSLSLSLSLRSSFLTLFFMTVDHYEIVEEQRSQQKGSVKAYCKSYFLVPRFKYVVLAAGGRSTGRPRHKRSSALCYLTREGGGQDGTVVNAGRAQIFIISFQLVVSGCCW